MRHKIVKLNKLSPEDFEKGTATVIFEKGIYGITLGHKMFKKIHNEKIQRLYTDPYFIFQLMDLMSEDRQFLEACYDALDIGLKKSSISKKEEAGFVKNLNEILSDLELPPFRPDIVIQERIMLPNEERER